MIRKISNNFGLILLCSALLGLIIPDPGPHAPAAILVLLFIIIFSSFFQFELGINKNRSEFFRAILFVLLRYVIFPVLVFYLLSPFSNFLAFAFYFLALIPAGTSSPVISFLCGGNYNLSILILVLSNLLVTFTIPFMAPLFSSRVISIDSWGLFKTLLLTIILPFFVHLPFRKVESFKRSVITYLPAVVVICLGLIFCIIIARNRTVLLNNLDFSIPFLTACLLFFVFLYLSGGLFFIKGKFREIVSGSIASGLNNVGLAVSLSSIYLTSRITILFIYGEFAWVIALIVVKKIVPLIKREN